MKKVLVAMSGGVDSAVAAKLLTDGGADCIGCTMKLYRNEDAGIPASNTCCSLDDVEDARAVANRLGMPYYVFNFSQDFGERIIDKFVRCYECGMTPNPCIDCNRYMKFDKLFDRAAILGCDLVATGHYARIVREGDLFFLKKAKDPTKDQSYVLYTMTQKQLAHTLFPLGELCKSETRRIAAEAGLVNADKPDSQDICFVPGGDYAAVITERTGRAPRRGSYVDRAGRVLGEHKGLIYYTVGQHKGLGIPFPEKMYVLELRSEDNTVVLGREEELYEREAYLTDLNWILGAAPTAPFRCKAKLRYRKPEEWATVTPLPNGEAHVLFDEPQRAITPGQATVFYDGDTVLGGGVVKRKE